MVSAAHGMSQGSDAVLHACQAAQAEGWTFSVVLKKEGRGALGQYQRKRGGGEGLPSPSGIGIAALGGRQKMKEGGGGDRQILNITAGEVTPQAVVGA